MFYPSVDGQIIPQAGVAVLKYVDKPLRYKIMYKIGDTRRDMWHFIGIEFYPIHFHVL